MDKNGTSDFVQHLGAEIPSAGFDWVSGIRFVGPKTGIPDSFLTMRPGPIRRVPFPDDLLVALYNLKPQQNTILEFAGRYGPLFAVGTHFHFAESMATVGRGDALDEWQFRTREFQQSFDLWEFAQSGNVREIKNCFRPLWQGGAFPLQRPLPHEVDALRHKPLDLARRVVVLTINSHLAPKQRNINSCHFSDCEFSTRAGRTMDFFSGQTCGYLRTGKDGQIQLAVTSTDLLTTAWLQFGAYLAGARKLKRCQAPDCGLLMDVTDAPRPGARLMHRTCEERLRKRRYREKQKGEQ